MLDRIQAQLEFIYGIRCEYRASDFLVDVEQARLLGGTGSAGEELLVSEAEESLDVALYLDPRLIARVSALEQSPAAVIDGELGAFCEVAEGVSHFVYLLHSVVRERHVSLLELETQAEVDKFALCILWLWGAAEKPFASGLVGRLFEHVRYRAILEGAVLWRYQEANRVARTYCERLLPMIQRGERERLLRELRHAYRLGAQAKLAYFAGSS
jgi:hypothetical protein